MQKEDGSFYHGVFEWHPAMKNGRWVNLVCSEDYDYDDMGKDQRYLCDVWGKNEINKLLGRKLNTSPSTPEKYHAYLAAAIARFGRIIREFDKGVSERCLIAVGKILEWLKKREILQYQYIDVQCGLALATMELYLSKKNEKLLKETESYIREVLSLQQKEGHFYSSKTCRGLEMYAMEAGDERIFIDYPFAYIICLVKYVEYLPTRELSCEIRKSLLRFVDLIVNMISKSSSFEHMPEFTLSKKLLLMIPVDKTCHGYNPYFLSIAYILISASKLLNNPRYREIGEKQIQWVLGANPRAMCFVNDEGYRNSGQYRGTPNNVVPEETSYYRHNRDMRWGLTVGMYGQKKGQPESYVNAGLSIKKQYDHKAQETWLNVTGWFLLSVVQLICAFKGIKR